MSETVTAAEVELQKRREARISEEPASPGQDESGAPEPEQSGDPHVVALKAFMAYGLDFNRLDLVDGGRSLQARPGLTGVKGMKLVLSPIESRHEKMMRAAVTVISSLLGRVEELEKAMGLDREGGTGSLSPRIHGLRKNSKRGT